MTASPPAVVRVATCRVQLRNGVTFQEVGKRLPYLQSLGISHLYLAPIFLAPASSTHGYDCVDPNVVDPVLGGEGEFLALCDEVNRLGMGLILDIVPNHLGIGWENPYWREMLRDGAQSDAARLFDVDWQARAGGTPGKILLPILGKPLADAMAAGELMLVAGGDDGNGELHYFDHRLPLASGSAGEDLQATLDRQHWRLAFWRSANSMLNWRRFFDITELAGVRVEDPAVFERTHDKLLELCRHPAVQGLRIDHVDGLANPGQYLQRLHDAWRRHRGDDPWLLVEKILAPGEVLPGDWPVAGTTGYEALNRLLAVFIDPQGYAQVETAWRDFGGSTDSFESELANAKREILVNNLAAELGRLATDLTRDLRMDFPVDVVRNALIGMVVATDRYRGYGASEPEAFDAALARVDWPSLMPDDDETISRSLAAAIASVMPPGSVNRRRFEQLSAPAMAKAMEDTTFYRWFPLLARNEVGNEPGAPLPTHGELHAQFAASASLAPYGLLATTTHDTKRGEDGRIRLALLSHPLATWRDEVGHWLTLADAHRHLGLPDLKTAYFIFQTLVSAWPLGEPVDYAMVVSADSHFRERLSQYLEKAFREGKRRSSWLAPDTHFEAQVERFVHACLDDPAFADRVHRYMAHLERPARALTLGQTVLKLTLPGVPDIYHGSERHDLSLVDPDNRRPVDVDDLQARLQAPAGQWWEPGAKQRLIQRLLQWRHRHPVLMAEGSYAAIDPGPGHASWFAFERTGSDGTVRVAVTCRFPADAPDLGASFPCDGLATGEWFDVLRGQARHFGDADQRDQTGDDWPVVVLFRAAQAL